MRFSKFWIALFLILVASAAGIVAQVYLSLPNIDTIDYYVPSESTILYGADRQPLARFHGEEHRRVVRLSNISPNLVRGVIATEDERFYSHRGVDLQGIARAMFRNFLYGRVVEGGSTITQQLAKNLFLTRRRHVVRKIAEIILALQIERRFTKQEILEYYLNQIYFGHNAYGIESASHLYFNKKASELLVAEAAMLAGIIEGPEAFSPYRDFSLAKGKQRSVLNRMASLRIITPQEARAAYTEVLTLYPENLKKFGIMAPYFVEHIQRELISRFGEEKVNKGGLRVYTTLNPRLQLIAEEAVEKFIASESAKYNFSQAALVAIDPKTGHIAAMVGGADFQASQFNRAIQAKRQPGSSFKPFVYTAAIEQGISPGTILTDRPATFEVIKDRWTPKGKWAPRNFDGKFRGHVTMQMALEQSLNIPSILLLEKVGIDAAIGVAKRMGITSRLEPGLSLALGASEVTLLEMVSAFGVFANAGIRVEPSAIHMIIDREGNVLYEYEPQGTRVIEENVAAIMDEMMTGVILRGTGARGNIGRPAAAKTGTSQDFRDAWFIGYAPQLVAGVWVGNDDNTPMKGVAEVAVCPRMWKEFMSPALHLETVEKFPAPANLVTVNICLSSGMRVNQFCPRERTVSARFFETRAPISSCYVHPTERPMTEEDEIKEETDDWGENNGN